MVFPPPFSFLCALHRSGALRTAILLTFLTRQKISGGAVGILTMPHSLCDPLQVVHRLFERCKSRDAQPQRILFRSQTVVKSFLGICSRSKFLNPDCHNDCAALK